MEYENVVLSAKNRILVALAVAVPAARKVKCKGNFTEPCVQVDPALCPADYDHRGRSNALESPECEQHMGNRQNCRLIFEKSTIPIILSEVLRHCLNCESHFRRTSLVFWPFRASRRQYCTNNICSFGREEQTESQVRISFSHNFAVCALLKMMLIRFECSARRLSAQCNVGLNIFQELEARSLE
uniref:AlNc14C36G3192 protein n=1 Tax=Albugo laibachii Nc14 TaxID=890382 RepID=F0W8R6_9STRA|nr:AlNc14C36G3192 [Albugo laibachii Nc14]|eukprot:CCA17524.1 AlNc14C36G3192 [Albugo laibachii Nc14]